MEQFTELREFYLQIDLLKPKMKAWTSQRKLPIPTTVRVSAEYWVTIYRELPTRNISTKFQQV